MEEQTIPTEWDFHANQALSTRLTVRAEGSRTCAAAQGAAAAVLAPVTGIAYVYGGIPLASTGVVLAVIMLILGFYNQSKSITLGREAAEFSQKADRFTARQETVENVRRYRAPQYGNPPTR